MNGTIVSSASMACGRFRVAASSLCISTRLPRLARSSIQFPKPSHPDLKPFVSIPRIGWDDVAEISEDFQLREPSDIQGFFHKVRVCNRGSELQSEFVPLVVEGQIVGYVHKGFVTHLRKFQDVFTFVFPKDGYYAGGHITLHSSLKTPEDRTRAVGDVIKCLGELVPAIPCDIIVWDAYIFLSGTCSCSLLRHKACGAIGTPYCHHIYHFCQNFSHLLQAYGVHMNGYVDRDGEKYLWIGKRSDVKPTYPGMLDHLVAGGLPHGITCEENLMKECEEEAGIPRSISNTAIPVGAVSYIDIDGYRYKRDVLFCYDLKLPANFVPKNEDGEVDSFRLVPLTHVANIIRMTEFFKPNCSLGIIDFLFRHGYITPDTCGYLKLLQSLRTGDCS